MWQRTYKKTYLVKTTSQYDGPIVVRTALPYQIGSRYEARDNGGTLVEFDTGAYCNRITIRCTSADGLQWEATLEYGIYNPSIFPQNPVQWPPKISWGGVKFERPIQKDINGNAVLNSAGDYFDPPPTADDNRVVLKVEVNRINFSPALKTRFENKINADLFYGEPAGTWKIADLGADLEYNPDCGSSDGFYYKLTFLIEYRAEGWNTDILDQGCKVLDANSKKVNAKTNDKEDVNSPILLDGSGKALASGGSPVFRTFHFYESRNFSELQIDPAGAPGQG